MCSFRNQKSPKNLHHKHSPLNHLNNLWKTPRKRRKFSNYRNFNQNNFSHKSWMESSGNHTAQQISEQHKPITLNANPLYQVQTTEFPRHREFFFSVHKFCQIWFSEKKFTLLICFWSFSFGKNEKLHCRHVLGSFLPTSGPD